MTSVLKPPSSPAGTTTTKNMLSSMSSPGTTANVVSNSGSGSTSNSELDERVVAKAALEAAEDALESLCAVHAGTFVAVEKRGQRMEQALQEMQVTMKAAKQKVELAQQNVWRAQSDEPMEGEEEDDTTTHSLAVLSEKHRVRRRTLLQHSALLELLELPSLMDACVRSDLYEEALSIASLANSLEKHSAAASSMTDSTTSSSSAAHTIDESHAGSGSGKVIRHVVQQIRSRQEDLRRHLLHRLESNVTMPDCLEVVTALRRLNSIDLELRASASANSQPPQDEDAERLYQAMEVKLQIDFLEARDVWLDSTTAAASASATSAAGGGSKYASSTTSAAATATTASSSSEDLLDTIERYRTRVFEIATQFNAIFRANSSSSGGLESSTDGGNSSSSKSLSAVTSSADLLALWTCRRVQAFLHVLQMEISLAASTADAMTAQATSTTTTTSSSSTNTAALSSQQFGAATLRDLLEATLFFASSMGRLGADFTAHLIPTMFEDALVDWIVRHCWVQQGVKPLQEVWTICNQANTGVPLMSGSSTSTSSSSSRSSFSSGASANPIWSNPSSKEVKQLFHDFVVPTQENAEQLLEQPIGPLRVLMQVPPLGRFVNAFLLGLNELRRCLLPSALPRLEQALNVQVLDVLSANLKALERQLITTPGKDKVLREIISLEYVPLWHSVVVPFCRASLWTSVGRATLAWQEYHAARQAIDDVIAEKQQVEEAAVLEKQRKEEEEAAAAQEEEEEEDEGAENDDEEDNVGNANKEVAAAAGGVEEHVTADI